MSQKKYQVTAITKAQTNWIEKNYEFLKESYLRKGYDSKIVFANYCLQKFEEAYLLFEEKKLSEERFDYDESF